MDRSDGFELGIWRHTRAGAIRSGTAGVITSGVGLGVNIYGAELATYAVYSSGWITEVLLFNATGTSTHIAFRSEINGTDFDARIDNVDVVLQRGGGGGQVPEPVTLAH